jgi:tetratricopeptide (TPR) repeat protein
MLLLGIVCLAGCQNVDRISGFAEGRSGLNPRQVADVKIAYARTLEKHGDVARATAAYLEALKQDPTRGDAYSRLAILYDQQGKFAESLEARQKALVARPGDPDLYCDMGYSLYLQRRWDEAEMNLKQALALAPDHARAHNNLGLVLGHAGRSEAALAEFHKAGCNEADARANLAFAWTLEGRLPDARQQYKSALAADPSSTVTKKEIKELDAVVSRLELARRPATASSDLVPVGATADGTGGGSPLPAALGSPKAFEAEKGTDSGVVRAAGESR